MDAQAKGLIKGLENWAKKVTAGYRDVSVNNMSSSFRDGLAFCAIIHHYRPDLIDFDSLSKENIFENNSLAFHTAERQLGVPALLDADDMVKYSHPDRLSIITYLSQLHNCFENQNKVKNLRASFRRTNNHVSGPPAKVQAVQPALISTKRHEVCHTCKNRVFILERLIVDNKLYHTACFRCSKCNALLNPGAYVESDSPGLYECAVCLPEESSMESPEADSFVSMGKSPSLLKRTPTKPVSPLVNRSSIGKSPLSDSVSNARSNFLQNSLVKSPEVKKVNSPFLKNDVPPSPELGKSVAKSDATDGGISVKDKISVFETSRNSKPESFFKSPEAVSNSVPKSPTPSTDSVSSAKSARFSVHSLSSTPINSSSKGEEGETQSTPKSTTSPVTSPSNTLTKVQADRPSTPDSDKSNCDTVTSPTILNKVPALSSPRFSRYQSQSSTDANESPNKLLQSGEYKSPFKSRDIFQTNLQPLKLSLSTTPKTELPAFDSAKIGAIDVPQIKSTYSKTLPRPGSDGSLSLEPKTAPVTDDVSSVLHSKWSRTTPRRSSLESAKPSIEVHEADGSVSVKRLSASIIPDKDSSEKSTGEFVSKLQYPSSPTTARLRSNIFRIDRQEVPMPSIRHSLGDRKILGYEKPSEDKSNVDESRKDVQEPAPVVESSSLKSSESPQEATPPAPVVAKPKVPETPPASKKPSSKPQKPPSKPKKEYPDDLNPFGDEEEEEEEEEYPDDLNPFGDDDDDSTPQTSQVKITKTSDYDESKNPFASDDDDDGPPPSLPPPRPPPPQVSPYQQKSPYNTSTPSPSGSLRGTLKKRLAPKPPKLSDIFPADSQDSEADSPLKTSPMGSRRSLQTPSPKIRKNKAAPPPPPGGTIRQSSRTDLASTKSMKDADNIKIRSTAEQEQQKQAKKKKRPAPPVPIPKRKDNKKIPLKEILREMKEIEEKQRECERQGRDIELLIRDRDKDEEPTIEEEEYIMQLFELVNQKNALFRRQAELMYIKRSQRLEEQQAEVESQIRQLLEKPEAEKSDDDRAKEEELILELKDIVDQRSSIIDSIEMDRRRELEEDASVQEQIEIKNGDLPITAEIKEKSSDKKKDKKEKKKEKKKKKHEAENGEVKKSSSKRKGLFK